MNPGGARRFHSVNMRNPQTGASFKVLLPTITGRFGPIGNEAHQWLCRRIRDSESFDTD
jgi:hypothetical protein